MLRSYYPLSQVEDVSISQGRYIPKFFPSGKAFKKREALHYHSDRLSISSLKCWVIPVRRDVPVERLQLERLQLERLQ